MFDLEETLIHISLNSEGADLIIPVKKKDGPTSKVGFILTSAGSIFQTLHDGNDYQTRGRFRANLVHGRAARTAHKDRGQDRP